jgi:hypothetical protein
VTDDGVTLIHPTMFRSRSTRASDVMTTGPSRNDATSKTPRQTTTGVRAFDDRASDRARAFDASTDDGDRARETRAMDVVVGGRPSTRRWKTFERAGTVGDARADARSRRDEAVVDVRRREEDRDDAGRRARGVRVETGREVSVR